MSKRRGPYKRYLSDQLFRIPRQTRHNWRERERASTDSSPAHLDLTEALDNVEPNTSAGASVIDSCGEENEESEFSEMEVDSDPESFDGDGTASSVEEEGGATTDSQPSHAPHPLLYEGAQITKEIGVKLLLSLATRHRLTLSALGDILKLVSVHLPPLWCSSTVCL